MPITTQQLSIRTTPPVAPFQNPSDDPVRNAWAFLVVSHQGKCIAHAALQRPSHFSRLVKPYSAESWLNLPDNLDKAARRFRAVQVTNDPWRDGMVTLRASRTCWRCK